MAEAYLAFYKAPGNGFDRLIRWWTRSSYSHVELILGPIGGTHWRAYSSSPRDGGVRTTRIKADLTYWDLVPVSTPDAAKAWFEAHLGAKYDWFGIFGFVWRPARGKGNRWFCSEACAAALGFTDPWRFDPAALHAAILRQ